MSHVRAGPGPEIGVDGSREGRRVTNQCGRRARRRPRLCNSRPVGIRKRRADETRGRGERYDEAQRSSPLQSTGRTRVGDLKMTILKMGTPSDNLHLPNDMPARKRKNLALPRPRAAAGSERSECHSTH